MAAPDYSELFASEKLSDLTIIIAEELEKQPNESLASEADTQAPSKRCKVSAGQQQSVLLS